MATPSSIPAWKISWSKEPGGPTSPALAHRFFTAEPHHPIGREKQFLLQVFLLTTAQKALLSRTISKGEVKELVRRQESYTAFSHHSYHIVTQGLELAGAGRGEKKMILKLFSGNKFCHRKINTLVDDTSEPRRHTRYAFL